MNENDSCIIKEYIFHNPLIIEIDSILDSCFNGWQSNCFHKFIDQCIYDIQLTKITNNEIIHLTFSGKSMNLYDLKN